MGVTIFIMESKRIFRKEKIKTYGKVYKSSTLES